MLSEIIYREREKRPMYDVVPAPGAAEARMLLEANRARMERRAACAQGSHVWTRSIPVTYCIVCGKPKPPR